MKSKKGWRERGKKTVVAGLALAAVLFVAVPPADAARGRRGASVVVTMKRGGEQRGELITVKPNSLLLLDALGLDRSIDLDDVRTVRVVRYSSKAGLGGLLGLVIGAAGGYLGGVAAAVGAGACPDCEAPLSGYSFGVLGGFVGLGVGVLIGEAASHDIVIPIDGRAEQGRAVQLRKLRRYARVASPL